MGVAVTFLISKLAAHRKFSTEVGNSDVPILGLRPRTARTEGFLGGPRPHKDRSSKTERPAVFFGP